MADRDIEQAADLAAMTWIDAGRLTPRHLGRTIAIGNGPHRAQFTLHSIRRLTPTRVQLRGATGLDQWTLDDDRRIEVLG